MEAEEKIKKAILNALNPQEIPGIYIFTNKINGKQYVGESINVKDRMKRYKKPKPIRTFERALLKYGFDGFDLEIIYYPYADKDKLIKTEKLLIQEYDCLVPYGYNICSEGTNQIGRVTSEHTKQRISKSVSAKCKTQEHIQRLRDKSHNKKVVQQFLENGDFIAEYKSTREAERSTGVCHVNIAYCCRGKWKQANGYIWKYIDSN